MTANCEARYFDEIVEEPRSIFLTKPEGDIVSILKLVALIVAAIVLLGLALPAFAGGGGQMPCPRDGAEAIAQMAILDSRHYDELKFEVRPHPTGTTIVYRSNYSMPFRTRPEWATSSVTVMEQNPITGQTYPVGSFNGNGGVEFVFAFFGVNCHSSVQNQPVATPTAVPPAWTPPVLEPWASPTPSLTIIIAPGAAYYR